MNNFQDKVVVITGAASGIGLGIAEKCAQEKMKIVLADIEEDTLQQAVAHIKKIHSNVIAVTTDVTKANQIEKLANITLDTYGQVNLLINNAGVSGPFGPLWEIPMDQLQWTLDVNLMGVIYALKAFVPIMLKQNDECHIVNTSSHIGLVSSPHLTAYQITKHAIVTITEALQHDLRLYKNTVGTSVFFPFFVQSKLPHSGRHLIDIPLYVASQAQKLLDELTEQTNKGISPLHAAEILFEGIKVNKFYIFTDDKTKHCFRERAVNILGDS